MFDESKFIEIFGSIEAPKEKDELDILMSVFKQVSKKAYFNLSKKVDYKKGIKDSKTELIDISINTEEIIEKWQTFVESTLRSSNLY